MYKVENCSAMRYILKQYISNATPKFVLLVVSWLLENKVAWLILASIASVGMLYDVIVYISGIRKIIRCKCTFGLRIISLGNNRCAVMKRQGKKVVIDLATNNDMNVAKYGIAIATLIRDNPSDCKRITEIVERYGASNEEK